MRPSSTPNRSTKFRSLKSFRPRLIRGAAAGLIATAILGTSGCKSMPFSLPKPSIPKLAKPNLSKLAFWKSENLMAKKGNLPKPPSLSFDSSPIRQSVASTRNSASREIESLRKQIASTKNQLTEPIREPYKYAAKDAVNKLAKKNDLDFNSGSSSRNKLPKTAFVDSKITQAQRDFQAALAGSSKAIDKSIGNKVADLKSAGNEFALPKSIQSGKANVDKSLMAVNKSLYNAQGNLASAAGDAVATAAGDDQLSLFEQRLQRATQKAKAAPAELASAGSASKSASNAFGGVAPPKPLATPAAAANNAFGGITTKSLASSQPTPPPAAAAPPAAVSAEMAELKAQLAQLRSDQQKLLQQQQLAASRPSAGLQSQGSTSNVASTRNTIPPTTSVATPAASEFVANLTARPTPKYPQMYPSDAPLRTASSANNALSSAPQNVLRGNFSPVANNPVQYPSSPASIAPATPSKPATYSGSQYPSTPYNSYGTPSNKYSANTAPTYAPSTGNTQASFQENGNSNLVITASTPVEPAQTHVSEVNIPDAVLKGTSNYAPGTVHALR